MERECSHVCWLHPWTSLDSSIDTTTLELGLLGSLAQLVVLTDNRKLSAHTHRHTHHYKQDHIDLKMNIMKRSYQIYTLSPIRPRARFDSANVESLFIPYQSRSLGWDLGRWLVHVRENSIQNLQMENWQAVPSYKGYAPIRKRHTLSII